MSSHSDESKIVRDLLEEDLDKEVDYESDTDFVGPNRSPLVTVAGKNITRREPNLFPERGAADMLQNCTERPT